MREIAPLAVVALLVAAGCAERSDPEPRPSAGPPLVLRSGPGGPELRVQRDPFALELVDAAGRVVARQQPRALGGARGRSRPELAASLRRGGRLELDLREGADAAAASLEWIAPRAVRVRYEPPAGSRRLELCDTWRLSDGEAIYGLTERASDSFHISESPPFGEIMPREVGSLDRRGESIEMYVRPTVALYAPFHISSAGYGLYVEGTHPGSYDVGDSDPDRLRLCFESDRSAPALSYVLFTGSPAEVLDAYLARTGRPVVPPDWAFLHWRWRDELAVGPPARVDDVEINAQVAEDLREYERLGIPAGVYMIDRPWSEGEFGFESFRWDRERLPNPEAMLASLARRGWKLALWSAGFAVGENAEHAAAQGFFAPGSDLVLDFTNPEARAWWKREHVAFARRWDVAAWKLDRGEEFIPSDRSDVWADGRNGRAVHNDYPVLQARLYAEIMREARGDDFAVLVRAGYAGTQAHAAAWGGDITGAHLLGRGPGTDLGLRSAILALLRAGFLGYPFWGSDTGGYYEFEDREVFARWLEFSAFCPLMEIGGHGAHAPWAMPGEPRRDEEMIGIYRRYVRLHHDLAPYVRAHARGPARGGLPIARALVFDHPDDPEVRDLWDQYLYGNALLVAPVWRSGQRQRRVYLPAGSWEDFWDGSRRFEGPAWIAAEAPLGRIPVFLKAGAEIPGRERASTSVR